MATANNLLVVLSSCQGLNGVEAFGRALMKDRAPFFALVAPESVILERDVQFSYHEFYDALLDKGDFAKAMKIFEQAPARDLDPSGARDLRVGKVTAEWFFLSTLLEHYTDTWPLDARLKRVRKVAAARGLTLSPEQEVFLAERYLPHQRDFEDAKRQFLMTDLPGNGDRFPTDLDAIIGSIEFGYDLDW